MINIYEFIKNTMASYLVGKTNQLPTEIDPNILYQITSEQQISGLIYTAIQNKEDLGDTQALFKKSLFQTIRLSAIQDSQCIKLCDFCKQKHHPIALLKGMEIKHLYPNPELRVMGDIDILINPADYQSITQFLMSEGYKVAEQESLVHSYTKDIITIEIHLALQQYANTFLYDYKDIQDNALPSEKHFAFLFTHLAKHISSAGCGIRMLYDIALFYAKRQPNIEQVRDIMKAQNLSEFFEKIMGLIDNWFDLKGNFDYDDKLDNVFFAFVFGNGAYGFEHLTWWQLKEMKNKSKLATLFRIVFPTQNDMRQYFSKLEKKPYLLGYFYIRRWFNRMKKIKAFKTRDKNINQKQILDIQQISFIKKSLNLEK